MHVFQTRCEHKDLERWKPCCRLRMWCMNGGVFRLVFNSSVNVLLSSDSERRRVLLALEEVLLRRRRRFIVDAVRVVSHCFSPHCEVESSATLSMEYQYQVKLAVYYRHSAFEQLSEGNVPPHSYHTRESYELKCSVQFTQSRNSQYVMSKNHQI